MQLLPTPLTTDANGGGRHGDWGPYLRTVVSHEIAVTGLGKYEPAIRRWEVVTQTPAPAPTEPNRNGNPRLKAKFAEWMMGWQEGWVTDLIGNLREGGISRSAAIRMIGAGVCTKQAEQAIRDLLD